MKAGNDVIRILNRRVGRARIGWLRLASIPLGTLAALASGGANSAVITYQVSNVSGDTWQYDYTVTNDGSTTGNIRLFDILFDPGIYDEPTLTITSEASLAADWDQKLLASGLLVPAAYDVLATGSGIGTGASVAGFSVRFHWLATGAPGTQPFEIYSADNFQLLGSGTTSSVPLPATLWLIGPALAAVAARVRRRAPFPG
jgi:hypothetical protein